MSTVRCFTICLAAASVFSALAACTPTHNDDCWQESAQPRSQGNICPDSDVNRNDDRTGDSDMQVSLVDTPLTMPPIVIVQ